MTLKKGNYKFLQIPENSQRKDRSNEDCKHLFKLKKLLKRVHDKLVLISHCCNGKNIKKYNFMFSTIIEQYSQ